MMPADFHLESRSDMNLRRSFEKALEKIFNKSLDSHDRGKSLEGPSAGDE
jgi:hypothetical protein